MSKGKDDMLLSSERTLKDNRHKRTLAPELGAKNHIILFYGAGIHPFQGDCRQIIPVSQQKPAGNIYDPVCSSMSRWHFYTGVNSKPFHYCYNRDNSDLDEACTLQGVAIDFGQTLATPECPSTIIESPGGGAGSDDFYGKRGKQQELTNLINAQYALLDGDRTSQILSLVHNESYSSNQLYDTLIYYTPYLSDDVLLASLFRQEFKSANSLVHLLIENAPHSNLIWKAIVETNHPFNADSLEKLIQYQDSTSARKEIIDSLTIYLSEKGQNYLSMAYYASVDTGYDFDEVIDSLENETYVPFRMLLGNLYMGDFQYSSAHSVYDSLKVYFREDKDLIALRDIQLDLFEDTLTYFDMDSTTVGDLTAIAFGDTSVAAFQAKAILELINDTIYPYPYEHIDTSGGGSKREEEMKIQQEENNESGIGLSYRLVPTIIKDETAGFVEIGVNENGELRLYDIIIVRLNYNNKSLQSLSVKR